MLGGKGVVGRSNACGPFSSSSSRRRPRLLLVQWDSLNCCKFGETVWHWRGNHEDENINCRYGFEKECREACPQCFLELLPKPQEQPLTARKFEKKPARTSLAKTAGKSIVK